MRSKGRSRPMSAALTPERKSARDRPASNKRVRGGKGERRREINWRARGQIARAQLGPGAHSPKGSTGPSCLAGSARSCERGEKAGDRLENSWSDSPRAVGSWRTLPEGQYRTLVPRGLSPVVPLPAVVCEIGRLSPFSCVVSCS